jgi:hypothetical protein
LHRLERFSGEKTWFLCPLLNGYLLDSSTCP